MSGFSGVHGVSDFICYNQPYMFLIDCKSHAKNTVNFADFSQYDDMVSWMHVPGLIAGTVIWFYDHDRVIFVPIETWKKIKEEGKKSFNIKMVGEYDCIELPNKKKRVYMETDYTALMDYSKEKYE